MEEKPHDEINSGDILKPELNQENDIDKSYRNALRLLLSHANEKMNYSFCGRDAIEAFYGYMFGEHIASKENGGLFFESKYDDANAELKANNSNEQFYDYIEGYREAAHVLIMNALIKGDEDAQNVALFPIIFLYRQYLELTLKDIYLYYSKDTEDDKTAYMKLTNHKLTGIWDDKVKPMVFPLLKEKFEVDDLNKIDGYIHDFESLDSDSYMFKYPIKKNRELYHKTSQKINLPALMKKMQFDIEKFFSWVSALLDIEKMI